MHLVQPDNLCEN